MSAFMVRVLIVIVLAAAVAVPAGGPARAVPARQATPEATPADDGSELELGGDAIEQRRQLELAAAAAQSAPEEHAAGIYAGSCDSFGAAPAFVLNPVGLRGAVAGAPAVPVETSYTTVGAGITALVAAAHAIVVNAGGPTDAVACGELGSVTADDLFVGLREQNGSGYAGIAWLHAEGQNTRVSLFLAQGLGAGAAAVPDGPPPPPEPEPEQEPEPGPVGDLNAYVSPTYGYSISYDASWQVVDGPISQEEVDYIRLANGLSFVAFNGVPGDVNAQQCISITLDNIRNASGVSAVQPRTDATGAAVAGGNAADAFAAHDIIFTTADGSVVNLTLYDRCIVIVPGQALLIIEQVVETRAYDQQVPFRDALLNGITLP